MISCDSWSFVKENPDRKKNGQGHLISVFILYPIIRALKKIGRFVFFSHKNNQERWIESEMHLEPS